MNVVLTNQYTYGDWLFWQLKELQTRQAALLTLQRDAEIRLAEAEEEVLYVYMYAKLRLNKSWNSRFNHRGS